MKQIQRAIRVISKSKVVKNSAAIMTGKVLQMIISFVISILSARYLGPSNFGIIGYAGAIVTFFIPIANLGINTLLTFEMVSNENEEGKILGTSLILQIVSSIFCVIGATLVAFLLNRDEKLTQIVVFLYSLEMIFKSFEILEYWFQAHFISKYYTIASTAAYIIVSVYKIILLVLGASVEWFAFTMVLDFFVIAILAYIYYKKKGGQKFEFSKDWAKHLTKKGRSLIWSSLMAAVYTQIDKIMIKNIINESQVGFYSLSSSIIGMWTFVLIAIVNSTNPVIVKYKNKNEELYHRSLIGRYALIMYVCLFVTLMVCISVRPAIWLLYGEEYLSAAVSTKILTFGTIFTYWGVAKGIWFISENKQKYLKWLSLCGAASNCILNYLLIPMYGINGAAIATVASEMIVNFISGFFIKEIRISSVLMLRSINPKRLKDIKLLFDEQED